MDKPIKDRGSNFNKCFKDSWKQNLKLNKNIILASSVLMIHFFIFMLINKMVQYYIGKC